MADNILYQAVKSITDLMVTTMDIQVDFADFCTITKDMGKAIMGSGEAEGEHRALEATELAIVNPLLDVSIHGAKGVLVSVSGKKVGLWEAEAAAERIREEVDEDATIIFGTCTDESLGDKIRVSVVATGLSKDAAERAPETHRLLNNTPKQETIIPPKTQQTSSENTQEPVQKTGIFVPSGKTDTKVNDSENPIMLSQELESVKKTVEDNFVPAEAVQMPFDEKELEQTTTNTTTDLLAGVIEDLDKDLPTAKTSSEEPAQTKEEEKKKTTGSLWDFFPGLWNEKKVIEESKKRLDPEANAPLERKIPPVLNEQLLDIPAFLNESKTE